MAKNTTEEKRKTYSLDPTIARDLARHAIDMSEKIGKVVSRQSILDALVSSLNDKKVYEQVINIVSKS